MSDFQETIKLESTFHQIKFKTRKEKEFLMYVWNFNKFLPQCIPAPKAILLIFPLNRIYGLSVRNFPIVSKTFFHLIKSKFKFDL